MSDVIPVLLHSYESEQAVVGSMLIDPECIADVGGAVQSAEFYAEANGKIFRTILDMHAQGQAIDHMTVLAALGKHADDVGGLQYLVQLTNVTPTSATVRAHAEIVHDRYLRRRMARLGREMIALAQADNPLGETLAKAQVAMLQLSQAQDQKGAVHYGPAMLDIIEREYRERRNVARGGISSGISDVDAVLGGLHPGWLVILAARPKQGKTTFALQVALDAAKHDKTVLIFSLEMSVEEIILKTVFAEARVDAKRARLKVLPDSDWDRALEAVAKLSPLPVFIDDSARVKPTEMAARARRVKMQHGLDLVVIDYLQLMSLGGRQESRQAEVSEISRSIKQMARELDVPVIAVSQLNRSIEQRQDKEPQLSDLRESGSLEQDADVIAFLHRPKPEEQSTEFIVKGHRHGPIGKCTLQFDATRQRFYATSGRDDNELRR